MKTLFAVLLFAYVGCAQGQAPNQIRNCKELWQVIPTLQVRDYPLFSAFGEPIEELKMKQLVFTDGEPYVPGNELETNCYLDRSLELDVQRAIKDGAKRGLSAGKRLPEEIFDAVEGAIDVQLSKITGREHLFWDLMIAIDGLYRIGGVTRGDPGRLQLFANSRGLYRQTYISRFVLITYIRHLGVRHVALDRYIEYLRQLDMQFRPPVSFVVSGCIEPIEYAWPDTGREFVAEDNVREKYSVHYGICGTNQVIWKYHYQSGWSAVVGKEMSEFCSVWRQEKFKTACERALQEKE